MVLCVRRDNGIGIAESDQESVFERFFRAHTHRDAHLGVTGSGLGLAIVEDGVKAMGGSIRCQSGPRRREAHFSSISLDSLSGGQSLPGLQRAALER
jgi:signal transduction histidine kinase